MAKFNEKISTILNSQLPEFVVADHPKFAEFLKTYYQLLESAELKVKPDTSCVYSKFFEPAQSILT